MRSKKIPWRLTPREAGEEHPGFTFRIIVHLSIKITMLLLKFLSLERVENYRRLSADSEKLLLARYLWNIALCEACYPALSLFEVALRNAIDHTLTANYGAHWLNESSDLLKLREKTEIEKRKGKLTPSYLDNRNQLIVSLTLGFWTGVFRKEYAQLWHQHIKEVFPHLSAKCRTPGFVFQHLKNIHSFRNRVFHHEPIWHRANLLQQYQKIKMVLDWLSPDLRAPLLKLERFIKVHETGENAYLV